MAAKEGLRRIGYVAVVIGWVQLVVFFIVGAWFFLEAFRVEIPAKLQPFSKEEIIRKGGSIPASLSSLTSEQIFNAKLKLTEGVELPYDLTKLEIDIATRKDPLGVLMDYGNNISLQIAVAQNNISHHDRLVGHREDKRDSAIYRGLLSVFAGVLFLLLIHTMKWIVRGFSRKN